MAEQFDIEAAVRFYAEGDQAITAAVANVVSGLRKLEKESPEAANEIRQLEDRIGKFATQLRNINATAAVKQIKELGSAARDQQNIYNDYLASQKEGKAAQKAAQKAIADDAAAIEKQRQATARAAQAFIQQGQANEKAAASSRAAKMAREQEARATQRQAQAARDNAAAVRGETQARQAELAALRAAIQARHTQIENLPRLRYALYDVASTAQIAGVALLGMSTAIAAVSITFDRNFADIERTSGATGFALQQMRKDFDDLYRSIPVSFSDLTDIGTLGGQLNIASSRLASFTETVAKFSATSNVSVEASATAFGRLDQLLPDVQGNYEALSDAILKVGVNSVATEDQIIAITSQLAGVATTANLSSQELIALSGTLASLGTAPELARGAVTRLFANIETAIAGGGERLEAFAQASGRTSQQFREDWGKDSYSVLVELFSNLGTAGGNLGNELRRLGVTASRDIPVFQKLAQSSQMLTETLDDATSSAGETANQYSILTSTVAEKLNILLNNFNSLIDSIGSSTSALGGFIDAAIFVLDVIRRITETPIGQFFSILTLTVGAFGGVALIAIGTLARYLASIAAVATATKELGASNLGLIGTFRALTAEINSNTAAMGANAGAAGRLKGALGRAGLVGAIITMAAASATALHTFQGLAADTQLAIQGLTGDTEEWVRAIQEADLSKIETIATRAAGSWNSILGAAGGDLDNFAGFLDSLGGGSGAKLQQELMEIDAALAAFAQSGNAAAATENLERLRKIMVEDGSWSNEAFNETFSQTVAVLEDGSLVAQQAAHSFGLLESEIYDLIASFTDVANDAARVQGAIHDLGVSLGENGVAIDEFSESGRKNMFALLETIDAVARQTPGDAAATAANLQALYDTLITGAGVSASSLNFLAQTISALRSAAGGAVASPTINFGGLMSGFSAGTDKAARGLDKVGRSAGGAAKQVRTLVDYANDLAGVFSRAFDIRFKSQLAMDTVADSWENLVQRIDDARIKLLQLQGDLNVKEFFLSVAVQYGDNLRAGVLQGEIADLNKQIADTQAEASTELNGNTKAARLNRKTLSDLVKQHQDYIVALAEGGADQATLNAAVNKSRAEFIAQAQALGFSNAQLQPYIASFNDLITTIGRVPRNITVTANADPALQALNEFAAKARSAGASAGSGFAAGMQDGIAKTARGMQISAQIANLQAQFVKYAGTAYGQRILESIASYTRLLSSGSYAEGGYTGRGGKYEPAGIVHRGEYVIPKEHVNQRTGLPYASALGQLQAGTRGSSSGGYAGGGYVNGGFGGVFVLDHAQYNGLVRALRESGGGNLNAQSIQGIVNTLNTRDNTLGRG